MNENLISVLLNELKKLISNMVLSFYKEKNNCFNNMRIYIILLSTYLNMLSS